VSADNVDPLRNVALRLYEQEREERNERRGLEQRAATTTGGVLVALSLILNTTTGQQLKLGSSAGILIVFGLVLAILGMLVLTFALSGAHTNPDLSLRQALQRPEQLKERAIREPQPLTEDYVAKLQERVSRLADRNARLVPVLRVGSLILGTAVYLALVGAAVKIFD
jgi:Zn-dependent protease with chaperone function